MDSHPTEILQSLKPFVSFRQMYQTFYSKHLPCERVLMSSNIVDEMSIYILCVYYLFEDLYH